VGILAGISFLLAAVFKPPISLELSYAKTNEDDARVRIVVRRWKKVRVYSLDDLTNISISDYRTSVPLVYLVLSDGLAVGPLLRDPGAERFVLRLSEAMSAEGRGRDSFLWRQIQELLEYFRSTSSQ
jgi:hypothetical protein